MGEITGTVWSVDQGARRAVAGARVELTRLDCTVAAATRSAFDGFFDFSDVAPGLYTLRVSADGLSDSVLEAAIEPTGTLLEGQDLVLRRR